MEKALGKVSYDLTDNVKNNRIFARSLFIVKDVKKGDAVTPDNVRSIRPGYGMNPKYYCEIIGKRFRENISKGTPLEWWHIEK